MKILVVYFTVTGNNKLLAEMVSKKLGADLEAISTPRKYKGFFGMFRMMSDGKKPESIPLDTMSKNPADYDLTILCAPVWGGHLGGPAKAFLLKQRGSIKKLAAILSVGGGLGGNPTIAPDIESAAGIQAIKVTELALNDLMAEKDKNQPMKTMGKKMIESEMKIYTQQIDSFIASLK